jgi:hypothetical protein
MLATDVVAHIFRDQTITLYFLTVTIAVHSCLCPVNTEGKP